MILGLPYSSQIDLWSAGCVAAELFLDFAIFACDSESDAVHAMAVLLGDVPERLLSASQNWWKFYDMTPQGFRLKMNPVEVLLQRHLYHTSYEQTGPMKLEQIIMGHFPLRTEEDIQDVQCFAQFVLMLLEYDPLQRLTAEQALTHPFITGEPFRPDWRPPFGASPLAGPQSAHLTRTSSHDEISARDFLSLM